MLLRELQIAGEPLEQTVYQYGPFVMTSREEIQKTLIDCKSSLGLCRELWLTMNTIDQSGQNGFEKAHTWKSEIAQK
jgi:hypothetical protein